MSRLSVVAYLAHGRRLPELRSAATGGKGLSRYVEVEVEASLDELVDALRGRGLAHEVGTRGRRIMLQGSLECAGQPVDLRLAAGILGAVEDFGFVVEGGRLGLVCGDVDLKWLEGELLSPLTAHLVAAKLKAASGVLGVENEVVVDADGTRRIVVRRK